MNFQLQTTWKHIRRSPYQALSAVMIMTLTFFAGLAFAYLSLGADKMLTYLEKKPQIILFFNDSVTSPDQVGDLKTKLENTGKASKIKFVSKDDALKIYQERNKSDPLLLELVTAKTLPASLEIGATKAVDLPVLYDIVKDVPNVEDISYQKDIIGGLIGVVERVRKIGAGLFVFLAVTSVFIILTVVGMKISMHKEEIDVQRLVGASKWYIRWPFIFEGIFYGMGSALVAWMLEIVTIILLNPYIRSYTADLQLSPIIFGVSDFSNLAVIAPFQLTMLGIALLAGMFVGAWGSSLAVWRYLKD